MVGLRRAVTSARRGALLALLALALTSSAAHAGGPRRPAIIATVGPRSADRPTLRAMVRGGMKVARVNLSHNDRRSAGRLAAGIREAARLERRAVPLLFDLPGGKVRLGRVDSPVTLVAGKRFDLLPGSRAAATATSAAVAGRELGHSARAGDRILLDDGRLEVEVDSATPERITTRVVRGGALRSKMGLGLADRELHFPAMTGADRRKLAIAVDHGADWIGVSMVQGPHNLRAVRRALDRMGASHVKVVAKIESRSALDHLDAILDESDIVMIARGDLAVAVGKRGLAAAQRRIAAAARRKGVPFIVASNLMTGMQSGGRPTRANRADLARARGQEARWVMLNETALGAQPADIVETADRLLGD
jgi:pyruvate kinase